MPPTQGMSVANERIDVDLPCVKCGYNLRTLTGDATCPECGTRVVESSLLPGFRFKSRRVAQCVRRGLAVLVIAVLLSAVFYLFRWLVFRFGLQFYQDHTWAIITMVRTTTKAPCLAFIIRQVAIILLCFPVGSREMHARPRVGLMAAAMAAALIPIQIAYYWPLLPVSLTLGHNIWVAAESLSIALLVFALVLLAGYLESPGHRDLRWLVRCSVLVAFLVIVIEVICAAQFWVWAGSPTQPYSPLVAFLDSTWPYWDWWHRYVIPACWIVFLVTVGLYYRRLNSALRLPQVDPTVVESSNSQGESTGETTLAASRNERPRDD